jgi:hypothetical protein
MGCSASVSAAPPQVVDPWQAKEEKPVGARNPPDSQSPTTVAPETSNAAHNSGNGRVSLLDAGWASEYDKMPLPPHSGLPYWYENVCHKYIYLHLLYLLYIYAVNRTYEVVVPCVAGVLHIL